MLNFDRFFPSTEHMCYLVFKLGSNVDRRTQMSTIKIHYWPIRQGRCGSPRRGSRLQALSILQQKAEHLCGVQISAGCRYSAISPSLLHSRVFSSWILCMRSSWRCTWSNKRPKMSTISVGVYISTTIRVRLGSDPSCTNPIVMSLSWVAVLVRSNNLREKTTKK